MKKLIKNIYNLVPFKNAIFNSLKKVWVPSRNIYQHLHFEGVIDIAVDQKHSFKMEHYGYQIENELYWEGIENGWEKLSLNLWTKLSKDAEIIFDIGANTGIYSLISKTVNPSAKVYAFEPVDFVFSKLEHNNNLNGYDIDCIETACSDFSGEAKVFLPKGAEHITSVTVNKSLLAEDILTEEKLIKTVRLDEFIERNNLSKIDLMKIDVETHEPSVLNGMSRYLELFKPTLLIEILEDEIGAKVQQIINGLGYLYFDIDEMSQIKKVDNIRKSSHFNYLVCQPETAKKLNLI